MQRAAHIETFVRDLFPQALQPVVLELIDRGYGVCEFDRASVKLVKEGLFGERRVRVTLDPHGNPSLARA